MGDNLALALKEHQGLGLEVEGCLDGLTELLKFGLAEHSCGAFVEEILLEEHAADGSYLLVRIGLIDATD